MLETNRHRALLLLLTTTASSSGHGAKRPPSAKNQCKPRQRQSANVNRPICQRLHLLLPIIAAKSAPLLKQALDSDVAAS